MSQFKELGLHQGLLKALKEMGYEQPTPIQQQAIPQLLLHQNDVKAFAQTGTGKTAAFSLPIIEMIDAADNSPQAIILSPTRELAIQIGNNIAMFTKYLPDIKAVTVYGGASIENQINDIKKGAHIIVGTPGRTLDLIRRNKLKLHTIKWLVLDEADEMLNMGFKEDLDQILQETPDTKQTLLFSATFPDEVDAIARNYMKNPVELSAGKRNIGAEKVQHEYYQVTESNRYEALKRIADMNPDIYSIVFCRTRRETKDIAARLIADGYNADALHGDLSQGQRDIVMEKFRARHLQILVATDVAARGLDVDDLTHVINYKLPDQTELYTHRSGRTGRAGKEGISISIITSREKNKLKPIERKLAKTFTEKPVPTGREVCEKQLFTLIEKVKDVQVNEDQIASYLKSIYAQLEGIDRDELIKKFVSIEFNRFLAYYENSNDLGSEKEPEYSNENFTRFYINLGKMDKVTPAKLMGIINENLKRKDVTIGRIELLRSFSFFEIDSAFADEVLQAFKNVTYNKRTLFVEVTNSPKKREKGRRKRKDRKPFPKQAFDFPKSKKKDRKSKRR